MHNWFLGQGPGFVFWPDCSAGKTGGAKLKTLFIYGDILVNVYKIDHISKTEIRKNQKIDFTFVQNIAHILGQRKS